MRRQVDLVKTRIVYTILGGTRIKMIRAHLAAAGWPIPAIDIAWREMLG